MTCTYEQLWNWMWICAMLTFETFCIGLCRINMQCFWVLYRDWITHEQLDFSENTRAFSQVYTKKIQIKSRISTVMHSINILSHASKERFMLYFFKVMSFVPRKYWRLAEDFRQFQTFFEQVPEIFLMFLIIHENFFGNYWRFRYENKR